MFKLLFSAFSVLLLLLSYYVSAVPVKRADLIAFAPSILTPTGASRWTFGSIQSVSWRTDNVPAEAQNYTVTVLLGYLQNNSENLDIKTPLASQVPIMSGMVQVNVPTDIPERNNYIVAVIGDSGDISPTFAISNP